MMTLLIALSCNAASQSADGASNEGGGDSLDAGSESPVLCSGQSSTCDDPDTIRVTSPFERDAGGVCLPCGMSNEFCCPNGKSVEQWRCPDGYSYALYFDNPPSCERADGGSG
jgi:hypothetical protein